jgi:hypothetical protein
VPPRARTRRPFSIWSLVVVGFIVINLARGFLAAGSPDPTEPPPTTVSTGEPAPTVAGAPGSAGLVEFGTEQNDDCTFPETFTAFDVGAAIFWSAQFKHSIAAKVQVEWSIAHDGAVLDSGTGPADTPPGAWDSICSGDPLRYFAVGEYTLEIWTAGHHELLSTGTYTLFALEATPATTP